MPLISIAGKVFLSYSQEIIQKMDNGLIPRRYAKALYKFALEHGSTEKVYEEMKEVIQNYESNPDLQKTLSNPFVSSKDKAELLKSAAGAKVENDYLGFIQLVIKMKREDMMREMAYAYRDLYREANKISQVKITTAIELPDSENKKLQKMVAGAFPERKLEFSSAIDPALIGGFMVDVDDFRMDASISNEIEQLRLNLISK